MDEKEKNSSLSEIEREVISSKILQIADNLLEMQKKISDKNKPIFSFQLKIINEETNQAFVGQEYINEVGSIMKVIHGKNVNLFNKIGKRFLSEWNVKHNMPMIEYKKIQTQINFSNNLNTKISALRDLSQSRHLLIRGQIELSFLEKIQAADSLEALQSIENELNNPATDVDLIQKLLKYVREKQAFY